eukprot:3156074-Pyramimonas_sp.AAC.1
MPSCSNSIVLAQEHHADREHLPGAQAAAARLGVAGLWAAAPDTGRGGTHGGLAALAPKRIRASHGPGLEEPEL